MRPGRPWEGLLLPAAVASLTLLLVALAVLQYRWIGEIGEAERGRLRAGLEAAAERTAEEMDRELGRIGLAFQPVPGASLDRRHRELARELAAWRRSAPVPGLIADLLLVVENAGEAPLLLRLDEASGDFAPFPWPDDLFPLAAHLRGRPGRLPAAPVPPASPGAPLLILPSFRPAPGGAPFDNPEVLLIRLDRKILAQDVVASIVSRQMDRSGDPALRVAVLSPSGPVWRSAPELPPSAYLPAEVERPLLGMPAFGRGGRGARPGVRPPGLDRRGPPLLLPDGPWRLVIRPAAGSLDAVVARTRARNLGVSAGVLALLAASFAVLVVATQRAGRLARQRMELVAGVTHELNTPLAAIRSAGQNLADGVVADGEAVRRYGALIEKEGRRLSALVGQALNLAGIESGAHPWRSEPASLAEAVDASIAESRWLLAEGGVEVETDIPEDLPPVQIDRGALRLIVRNLVDNAARHAAGGQWAGLRARTEPGGRTVLFTVTDRGPGIAPEDEPHLFEPFYRGRDVVASAVPGSGLGLDLVRRAAVAHGGSVTVGTGPGGRGAQFMVRLRVAEESKGGRI